jgi:hypothetical protein
MAKKKSKLAKRAAELEAAVAGLFTGKPAKKKRKAKKAKVVKAAKKPAKKKAAKKAAKKR